MRRRALKHNSIINKASKDVGGEGLLTDCQAVEDHENHLTDEGAPVRHDTDGCSGHEQGDAAHHRG